MTFLAAIAWRNLWRHRRRSLITATAMAVALGLCMASIAFTDGTYLQLFHVMVEQRLGHIQVHHSDFPRTKSNDRFAETSTFEYFRKHEKRRLSFLCSAPHVEF